MCIYLIQEKIYDFISNVRSIIMSALRKICDTNVLRRATASFRLKNVSNATMTTATYIPVLRLFSKVSD